ncbi:MAG: hypothetical protein U1F53_06305 [Burkholderiaceae bacterium]
MTKTFSLRTLATALAGLLMALSAWNASAQTSARDDSLYQQLGGQPGLVRLMDDFMQRLLATRA